MMLSVFPLAAMRVALNSSPQLSLPVSNPFGIYQAFVGFAPDFVFFTGPAKPLSPVSPKFEQLTFFSGRSNPGDNWFFFSTKSSGANARIIFDSVDSESNLLCRYVRKFFRGPVAAAIVPAFSIFWLRCFTHPRAHDSLPLFSRTPSFCVSPFHFSQPASRVPFLPPPTSRRERSFLHPQEYRGPFRLSSHLRILPPYSTFPSPLPFLPRRPKRRW